MADLLTATPKRITGQLHLGTVNVEAITANATLTGKSAQHQILTPDAARDVVLPVAKGSKGLFFIIKNNAAGAFTLTVKDDAGTTIGTVQQNHRGHFVCDGTDWYSMGSHAVS